MRKHQNLIWAIVAIITTIFALGINALAVLLPLNNRTTQEISNSNLTLFTPAGYVFSIWGVIYIGMITYSIYQLWKKHYAVSTQIRPAFIIANLANGIWIILWHYGYLFFSVLVMLVLLLSLIYIYGALGRFWMSFSWKQRLFIQIPFSIYLAWICVATIANIAVFLNAARWTGMNLSPEFWAGVMILIATDIGAYFLWSRYDFAFAAVLVWSFVGIIVQHRGQTALVTTASVCIAILVAIGAYVIAMQGRKRWKARKPRITSTPPLL